MNDTIDGKMMQILAEEIAKEIDQEIINGIARETLMKQGWVKASFTTDRFVFPFEYRLDEVSAWIHTNATGEYKIFGKEFWFQRKKDLTAFILKWS